MLELGRRRVGSLLIEMRMTVVTVMMMTVDDDDDLTLRRIRNCEAED